jgi:hypothetical protein
VGWPWTLPKGFICDEVFFFYRSWWYQKCQLLRISNMQIYPGEKAQKRSYSPKISIYIHIPKYGMFQEFLFFTIHVSCATIKKWAYSLRCVDKHLTVFKENYFYFRLGLYRQIPRSPPRVSFFCQMSKKKFFHLALWPILQKSS